MRFDYTYKTLLATVLRNGYEKSDRTGTGTRSVFGLNYEVDLQIDFPLLTLREINWDFVVKELIWFLRGDEDLDYLHEHGINVWDPWAEDGRYIRKGYGYQWRRWGDDQIARLVNLLIHEPSSRRLIVSAWNADDLDDMTLPPCHSMFQCNVRDGHLDLMLYQRSCDLVIGLPYNAAEYSVLAHLLASAAGLKVGRFHHCLGDAHIYNNLIKEAHELVATTPSMFSPIFKLNRPISSSDIIQPSLSMEDFGLECYYPQAKMPLQSKVSV